MQDAWAYVSRVGRDEPLSERALLHAEVTAVNHAGRCLAGRLGVEVSRCEGSAAQQSGAGAPSAGCTGRACALQWTELVSLRPGETVLKLQSQALLRPLLWWPIHMGAQVGGHVSPMQVSPSLAGAAMVSSRAAACLVSAALVQDEHCAACGRLRPVRHCMRALWRPRDALGCGPGAQGAGVQSQWRQGMVCQCRGSLSVPPHESFAYKQCTIRPGSWRWDPGQTDGFLLWTVPAEAMLGYLQVFIRGGNYIASDWLLRWSEQRYREEVRMHAEVVACDPGHDALQRQPCRDGRAGLAGWHAVLSSLAGRS